MLVTRRHFAAALCVVLVGSLAFADKKGAPRPLSISGRVVDLEIIGEDTVITVAAGTEQGIDKTWRARFREGTTTKLVPDGEAILIRIDRRTTILKTRLTPEQVRANRIVQFDPK